jgi:alpha-tubulin suppressor-like RCC1 family protein
MHRHSWLVLLGVAVLGLFIAILADHDPSSLIFADSTSTLWAWGYNGSGTLGDGTTTNRRIPTQEATGAANWSAVAAGGYHTVALKSNGTLWAWGSNTYGQLGDGTSNTTSTPIQSGSDTNWSAIAAGDTHTIALKSDGTLWAWGSNIYGQLGGGSTGINTAPIQESSGSTNWSAIAAGYDHTVALKSDGTLWAWGSNTYGQLGVGTTANKTTPTQELTEANDWFAIGAGGRHTVTLKSDGTLWAWGLNSEGQLGDSTTGYKTAPTQESTGTTSWSAIAAGWEFTVALKSDGTLWAWGSDNDGQIGDGISDGGFLPAQEATGATNWSTISAGNQHTVALKSDGTLWAWGEGKDGRLGDGTQTNKNSPTQESTGATNWFAVAAGIGHTVALKSGGTQPTPTPIPTVSSWGLAALAAALLIMSDILLRRTSGHRPATTP